MTTSYPAGLDSYTNPTASDELDDEIGTRTHSEFHADTNDAIEAIQGELGTDPSGSEATVKARIAATETVANAAAQKSANLSDLASAATAFGNIKQAATTSATGVVELATAAETKTGTDTARAVTPAGLAASTALVFTPEMYGAVGDGTTNDAVALQACIDAATTAKGTAFLPSPTGYACSSTLALGTFTRIVGRGQDLGSGTAGASIYFSSGVTVGLSGGSNVTLVDLRIDGNSSAHGNTGFLSGASGTSSPTLRNVQFYRWGIAADIRSAYYSYWDRVEVYVCATGIKLTACYNVTLHNSVIHSCPIAIDVVSSVQPLNIFGGSIENYGTDGGIIGRAAANNSQVNLSGVYFESSTSNSVGIDWSATGAGTKSILNLRDCQVRLTEGECWLDIGSGAAALNTDGNRFICTSSSATTPVALKVVSGTGTISLGNDDLTSLDKGTLTDGYSPVDMATQAELNAHTGDTTDAHAGTAITNTPAGNIAATTVQAAINELDSEKQPLDTDLTAIAALASAANKVAYATGSGTWALADLTAFARTILDDANAAAALVTLGAAATSVVDVFTSSGTWTKRTGLTSVRVLAIAAGGGGGSGRRGADGAVRCGGGGGAGGGHLDISIAAADLSATETVTVGAAGAGGAAVTADDTNGNAGGVGGQARFGATTAKFLGLVETAGGGGGGTNAAGTGGTGRGGSTAGAAGGAASGSGGAGTAGVSAAIAAASGGAGGGFSAANAPAAGGDGGLVTNQIAGGTGGAATGAAGGAGSGATASASSVRPGSGGGGGGSGTGVAGGVGGAGGTWGAGGGGGAASQNGFASGAGGAGGPGIIVVINYF